MAKNNLKEEAAIFQRFFEDAIFLEGVDKNERYLKISNTLKFINDAVIPFTENQKVYDNTVFVMGPTGVGKSTLLNYIAGNDLFFRINDDRPGLFPSEDNSIAYVGKGEGSTTLAPNIWGANTEHFQGVTFIDCAGDFDSSGTVIEVINSKIKSVVAKNAKNAKILIVTSQDSISPSGSYGMIFKEGLEKSAQFLNNIDYFEDSIGLIVSHAGRMQSTNATVKSYLNNIINNPRIEKYKTTLKNLLENNCMTTFSKYSEEDITEGAIYSPPAWNANQREQIINLINMITFKPIPQGLFNDSSAPEVREQMGKAFEILKAKAVQLTQAAVADATQNKLVIHTTELKKFARFIEEEVICSKLKTGLTPYFQYLNKQKFLKVPLSNEIKKLNEELEFVAPFTKTHGNSQHVEENWSLLIGSHLLFKDILIEAKVILYEANDLFSSFTAKDKIITTGCFGERSLQLKTCFTDLYTAYKNKANIENNKNDDKYYFYQPEQQFKCMKQVSYTEQQPYTVSEPYNTTEIYTEIQRFYYGAGKYRCDSEFSHTRCHNIGPTHFHWDFGGRSEVRCYPENVALTRPVIKHKDVIKYQTITKYQEVPEYQKIQVKKFNESKYNADIKHSNNTIDSLRNDITNILSCMKAINAEAKQALSLEVADLVASTAHGNSFKDSGRNDEIKELFKLLNDEWKYIEYEAQALLDYQIELAGDF